MIRILHEVDRRADWEHLVTLRQLIENLPADKYDQRICASDGFAQQHLSQRAMPFMTLNGIFGTHSIHKTRSFCKSKNIDLIHYWRGNFRRDDISASLLQKDDSPTAAWTHIFYSNDQQNLLGKAINCPVKNKTIYPGIDAPETQHKNLLGLKEKLDVSPADTLILTPELRQIASNPTEYCECFLSLVWSAGMQAYGNPNTKIIIPGKSRAIKKLRKLANVTESRDSFVFTEDRYPFEHLCQMADILVFGPGGDVSVPAIAWAMASDTVVIAPACAASREVIIDGVNGILYPQKENWRRSATSIASMYGKCQSETGQNIRHEAKKTAENQFSLHAMIENYRRLYDETASA